MSVIVFKWGSITIYGYGLMWSIAILGGFLWVERESKRKGLDVVAMLDLVLITILVSVVSARLFHVVQFYEEYRDNLKAILHADHGGMVYFGGFLGGVLAVFGWSWWKRLPILDVADTVACYLPLGHAIGRIGCFFQGCCYGTLCESAWAVQFPRTYSVTHGLIGTPAYLMHLKKGLITTADTSSLPVHPTQIYAFLFGVPLFMLLFLISRRQSYAGQVLGCYLMLYSLGRFVLEEFRGDNDAILWQLTISQVLSILLFLGGALLISTRGRILEWFNTNA